MFALHRTAVRPTIQHGIRLPRIQRPGVARTINKPRTFVSEAIQTASEGFLDLALALPFPEAIPPYSGTIILVTVLSRFITVPFSLWVRVHSYLLSIVILTFLQAKQRQWRTEDVVLPQLLEERPLIFKRIHEEMKKDGFRGTREEAMKEHAKRAQPMVSSPSCIAAHTHAHRTS